MRISFDNLLPRGEAGWAAIYDMEKRTTWRFDLKGALQSLEARIGESHALESFTVSADGTGGYDLVIVAGGKPFAQNIPAPEPYDDSALWNQVEVLHGALVYIGTINLRTAEVTSAALNARAQELCKPAKRGYVLVDADANDWWYDADDWVNIGYYDIAQATNSSLGVVKGSNANMKVSVDGSGEMSVNGLQAALESASGGNASLGKYPQGIAQNIFSFSQDVFAYEFTQDGAMVLAGIDIDDSKIGSCYTFITYRGSPVNSLSVTFYRRNTMTPETVLVGCSGCMVLMYMGRYQSNIPCFRIVSRGHEF